MRCRAWAPGLLLLIAGCEAGPESTTLVGSSPFVTEAFKPPAVPPVVQTPSTKETADRVQAVACKLLNANPQLGCRPRVTGIGVSTIEIFHRGPDDVFITEGLVRRCQTDAQLAAVLSLEMGKAAAERDPAGVPKLLTKEPQVPPEMAVGSDLGSSFGAPDSMRMLELAKYAEPARHQTYVPPTPDVLAKTYLQHAGFDPAVLGDTGGLLQP